MSVDASPMDVGRADAHPADVGLADAGQIDLGSIDASVDAGVASSPVARQFHAATALADGRVLLTGGLGADGAQSETWIFDPNTEEWSLRTPLSPARSLHHSILLGDGTVLMVGGVRYANAVQTEEVYKSAVIYDPATDAYRDAGSMTSVEAGLWAYRLEAGPDVGKIIVGGATPGMVGTSLTFELYDPATSSFVEEKTAVLPATRFVSAAIALDDGRLLLVGGAGQTGGGSPLRSALLFDWTAGTFEAAAGEMAVARTESVLLKLDDGRVLIAGGRNPNDGELASAEIFDPQTGLFSATVNDMTTPRRVHALVKTTEGRIFVFGGFASASALDSIDEWTIAGGFVASARTLPTPLGFMAATPLPGGRVLLSGGQTSQGGIVGTHWVFSP